MVRETMIAPRMFPKKKEEDNDNQEHAFCEIVQDRVSGEMYQIVAIEIGHDLYSRRENVIVEPLDHRVKAFKHRGCVCSFAEKDNSFDDIIVVIDYTVGTMGRFSDLPQTNLWPLRNLANVLNSQRRAVLSLDHGFFDVAGAGNQADTAHVDLLCTLLNKATADVGVAVGQLLLKLGQAQTVGNQFLGVDRGPDIRE